jgi:hypothetical protein
LAGAVGAEVVRREMESTLHHKQDIGGAFGVLLKFRGDSRKD